MTRTNTSPTYVGQNAINSFYIQELNTTLTYNKKPDLVMYVEGTDSFPIWINQDWINKDYSKVQRIDLIPDSNGCIQVFFPETLTSLANFCDPYYVDKVDEIAAQIKAAGTSHPYYSRLKKIYGLNSLFKNRPQLKQFGCNNDMTGIQYSGDYENFNTSNLQAFRFSYSGDVPFIKDYIQPNWNLQNMKLLEIYGTKKVKILDFQNVSNFNSIQELNRLGNNCADLEQVIMPSDLDTASIKITGGFCQNSKITETPTLDFSSTTNGGQLFKGCTNLKKIRIKNTQNNTYWWAIFMNCPNLEYSVYPLDVSSTTGTAPCYGSVKCPIKNVIFTNIGKSESWNDAYNFYMPKGTYDFNYMDHWGEDNYRQCLIDSLLTYSYDRASNGLSSNTIRLSEQTFNRLSENEKAAITAKGFTITKV